MLMRIKFKLMESFISKVVLVGKTISNDICFIHCLFKIYEK